MAKKKNEPKPSEVRREKRKLYKILILLTKVYKKGAKSSAQKVAYDQIGNGLKKLRKEV
jgi:microcompartment protein CcmK/EutM